MSQEKDLQIARCFNALSHPRRAHIFHLLIESPASGQSFDTLVRQTGYAASALSHHLREMERCGVIRRKRKGPFVAYFLTTGQLARSITSILSVCQTSAALRKAA